MELDNLKTIWKEQETPVPETDPARLAYLLQTRTRRPIDRMRRNLRIEAVLMIIAYVPTILAYKDMFGGRLSMISLFLLLVFVFYWIYYYLKSQLLRNMQCVVCEVRSNLARQVGTLRKYVRFYLWSGVLVTLIAIIVAWETLRYSMKLKALPLHWWFDPASLLVLMAPFAVGLYYLNKWYIDKLYGRHIEKLQELLREMDEE